MGYLKGSVQVLPYPVALNDLKDSGPRRQELGIGQIGGVHRDEDAGAGYHLQLLMEGGACIELHNSHLQQIFGRGMGPDNTWDMCCCFGSNTAEMLVETDSCWLPMSYWLTDIMPIATINAGPLHQFL